MQVPSSTTGSNSPDKNLFCSIESSFPRSFVCRSFSANRIRSQSPQSPEFTSITPPPVTPTVKNDIYRSSEKSHLKSRLVENFEHSSMTSFSPPTKVSRMFKSVPDWLDTDQSSRDSGFESSSSTPSLEITPEVSCLNLGSNNSVTPEYSCLGI